MCCIFWLASSRAYLFRILDLRVGVLGCHARAAPCPRTGPPSRHLRWTSAQPKQLATLNPLMMLMGPTCFGCRPKKTSCSQALSKAKALRLKPLRQYARTFASNSRAGRGGGEREGVTKEADLRTRRWFRRLLHGALAGHAFCLSMCSHAAVSTKACWPWLGKALQFRASATRNRHSALNLSKHRHPKTCHRLLRRNMARLSRTPVNKCLPMPHANTKHCASGAFSWQLLNACATCSSKPAQHRHKHAPCDGLTGNLALRLSRKHNVMA